MRSWMLGWCTLVLMLSTVTTAGAGVVLEGSPELTGATRVLAWVQGPDLGLADARTGAPVEVPDLAERAASAGGRLLWVVESDIVDELGMRHVILRQRFRPAPGSVVLPGGLMHEGVPLHGAVVGLHYDPEGSIKVVGASMFEDADAIGGLALLTADHAYAMAAWGLTDRDGLAINPLGLLSPQAAAGIRRDARLELFSRGDGRSFDFVWTVPVVGVDGRAYSTRVHGATGELLVTWEGALPWSGSDAAGLEGISGWTRDTVVGPSCYPTPIPSAVTATARRQRDGAPRSVNPGELDVSVSPVLSAWYGQGVTHQAMTAAGGSFPEIRVYSGWWSHYNEVQCTLPEGGIIRDLRLVPLKTEGGSPVFEDLRNVDDDVDIAGRAAGDALYHARRALAVLAELGWAGFASLDVVVNSWYFQDGAGFVPAPASYQSTKHNTDRDGIHFYHHSADEAATWEPAFATPTRLMYSAAQDVVAHEIGHGVVLHLGTGWVRALGDGFTWGDVMHEGWADVIGLIVEWATQPHTVHAGMSLGLPETADWFAGEDTILAGPDASDRRWDDYDDGPGVGYSLHANDNPGPQLPNELEENPYYTSNRLALAFRLSVTGGRNPVCNRLGVTNYWTGCEKQAYQPTFCTEQPWYCPEGSYFSVAGISNPEFQVGDMGQAFFRALRVYHMHMDDWDWNSVADMVKVAAHDLFRSVYVPGTWPPQQCDDAFAHQIAVAGAFHSVGYDGSGGWVCMCESPCSPPIPPVEW